MYASKQPVLPELAQPVGEGRACRRGSVGTQRRGTACCHRPEVLLSLSGCKASQGAWRLSGHQARAGSSLFKSGCAENTCGLAGCSAAMAGASRGEPEPAPTSALAFCWRVPPCAGWSARETTSELGPWLNLAISLSGASCWSSCVSAPPFFLPRNI